VLVVLSIVLLIRASSRNFTFILRGEGCHSLVLLLVSPLASAARLFVSWRDCRHGRAMRPCWTEAGTSEASSTLYAETNRLNVLPTQLVAGVISLYPHHLPSPATSKLISETHPLSCTPIKINSLFTIPLGPTFKLNWQVGPVGPEV